MINRAGEGRDHSIIGHDQAACSLGHERLTGVRVVLGLIVLYASSQYPILNPKRKRMVSLTINGSVHQVDAEPDTPLLWVLREQVGLTGTKYGCGVAQCGACAVHINDEVQRSCSMRVGDVQASDRIVTIEGLSASTSHPVQKAWAALD